MDEAREKSNGLSRIIGEQLSAVCFVMDYLQLQFNGCLLTVLTRLTVICNDHSYSSEAAGYRDLLCERITQKVCEVVLSPEKLSIIFEDDARFDISLKEENYIGAEAIHFHFPEAENMPIIII